MSIRLTVHLDEEVARKFEDRAASLGMSLETYMAAHLAMCADYTSEKPLYLTDENRRELERLLGRNFDTAEDFMIFMRRMHLVDVADTKVSLDQPLLQLLQRSCGAKDFKPWITHQVRWMLQHYMGMA